MNRTHLKTAAALAFFLTCFGLVGQSDYEDAITADQHYTEMVCAGYWPDHDDRKPNCSDIQIAATNH